MEVEMNISKKKTSFEYTEVKVISNINLQGDYYMLKVEAENLEQQPFPGQFYQVKPLTINNNISGLGRILFKPLSVYDYSGNSLSFMMKVIGSGTYDLSTMIKGDVLAIYGPLGNSFINDDSYTANLKKKKRAVLISGGIGYAPLYYLHKKLLEMDINHHWLHGGRTADDLFDADYICTDDGSKGSKGFVTNCLDLFFSNHQDQISQVYCCGPKPMMKKVYQIAECFGFPTLFSMEEYMACGIGVCLGCAVKKSKSYCDENAYMMVCKDGPVFEGKEVDWDE